MIHVLTMRSSKRMVVHRRRGSRRRVFVLSVLGLGVAALVPIWSVSFVAAQDLPTQLLVSFVATNFGDPASDWSTHYERAGGLGPYSLVYLLLGAFSNLVPIETAGRLLVSLPILLLGGFAVSEAGTRRERDLPWALLLLFPAAFSQVYYLGFLNYALSLPLILIALRELERLAGDNARPFLLARLGLWLSLIFLCHPFSVLIVAGLGGITALLQWPDRRALLQTSAPVLLLSLAWLAWWASLQGFGTEDPGFVVRWWTLGETLRYLALFPMGHHLSGPLAWVDLALWAAVLANFAISATSARGSLAEIPRSRWAWLIATGLAFAALPSGWRTQLGDATYLNTRLAPLCYLLLILALSHIPLRLRAQQGLCIGLCAALLWTPLRTHQGIAAEIDEVAPLFEAMDPGARVLPVYLSARSEWLDPHFFYQFHTHAHDYYHLRRGGGANPALIRNRLFPIQLRADAKLPALDRDHNAETVRAHYRYVLLRHAGLESPELEGFTPALRSGHWTLIDTRRTSAKGD